MPTVDQINENIRQLIEHADKYFAGTQSKEDLFKLLEISFGSFSDLMAGLAKRGVLSAEDVAVYQWSSCITAALIRTLELEPKYGSFALEQQLRQNFRAMLKTATIATATVRGPPATRQ